MLTTEKIDFNNNSV